MGTIQPVRAKILEAAQTIPPRTRMMRTSLLLPDRRLGILGKISERRLGGACLRQLFILAFPRETCVILLLGCGCLNGVVLKPGGDTAVPGTRPAPARAEAKASVPALRRSARRCLVVISVRGTMDGGAVVVGVVPALYERR